MRSPARFGDVRIDELERRDRAEGDVSIEIGVKLVERAAGERGAAALCDVRGEVARKNDRPAVAVGDRRAREGRVAELCLDSASEEERATACVVLGEKGSRSGDEWYWWGTKYCNV